jgi:tRNA(Ile)-lysidine synthase
VDAPVALTSAVAQFMSASGCEGPGIVAVSGGPDSVALLRALLALCGGNGLVVAHLNHGLRGAESDGDEAFVRALHADLSTDSDFGLKLRCARIDVAASARSAGDSLETAARRIRYEWLTAVAREIEARWIATGHTADDQAETVLYRFLRGTGLKGLCGIPARRELAPGIQVVRPLLGVRRQGVFGYLEGLHQGFREDSSNQNTDHTRNRIRHELLPHLKSAYNPAVVTILCRLAAQAAEVQQDQERQAGAVLREAELPRAGSVLVFDVAPLARAPRHLVREMFRLVWTRESWPQGALGFEDWERITTLVEEVDGTVVEMAGGVRARRRGRVVQLELIL